MSHERERDLSLGAYNALFEDIKGWVPGANLKALSWDQTQLSRLIQNRGMHFLTVDLPQFGKDFESALQTGSLDTNVPGFARLKTRRGHDGRPRLFWALTSRVFDYCGNLREVPCTSSIFAIRQLCYMMKKLKGNCHESKTFEAIKDFFSVEDEMGTPDLDWDNPFSPYETDRCLSALDGGFQPAAAADQAWTHLAQSEHGHFYQRVFDLLVAQLPSFDSYRVEGRHGPGAVSDAKRGESKYSFPHWTAKLESIFPFDRFGSHCFMQGDVYPNDGEVASKLACVPKTQKGPRLIASEPVCYQWIQQGIADWFVEAFRKGDLSRSIRIHDQSLSQQAARAASLGAGATIDLSSASDRLSCRLVERVFRRKPELLSAMMACRTSWLANGLDRKHPQLFKLKKFSTMGSALTFPVQSFVFFAIAFAATLRVKGRSVSNRSVRLYAKDVVVYGDDIVVPADVAPELVRALHALGLKVNVNKSFWEGKFRESCGTDWYNGECVTPAYIRSDFNPRVPSTVATIVETSNNFHKKGLWHVAAFLSSRLPERILRKIPIDSGDLAISGLYSYCGTKLDHLSRRFNNELQRYEYRVADLSAKQDSCGPDGVYRLRQWFTERPSPMIKWDPKCIDRLIPTYRERYAPIFLKQD